MKRIIKILTVMLLLCNIGIAGLSVSGKKSVTNSQESDTSVSTNTLDDAELRIEIINHNTARITFISCPWKEEATNIEWEMKYTGLFVFLNLKPQTGNIPVLRDGESIEISYEPKGFMLGFGPIIFKVTATEIILVQL